MVVAGLVGDFGLIEDVSVARGGFDFAQRQYEPKGLRIERLVEHFV